MTDALLLLLLFAVFGSKANWSSKATPRRKGPPPEGWPKGVDNLGVHPLPPNPLKRK